MTKAVEPCLIINNGTLGGLVAAWSVGVVRPGESADLSSAPPLTNWFPADALPARARRRVAVDRQVAICGLGNFSDRHALLPGLSPDPADDATTRDNLARAATTAMLISAAVEAARRSCSKVIWPIHVGGSGGEANTDINLDTLADICDRALLVSQLATIDLPRVGASIKIETPYADFTDAELLELAIDVDAPLAACHLCQADTPAACGECPECIRWRAAFDAVDPHRLLESTPVCGPAHL